MTTNRISWIFVERLSTAASRPEPMAWSAAAPACCRSAASSWWTSSTWPPRQRAESPAQGRAAPAQLVGEVEVEHGVQVGVVAADDLRGCAQREREGPQDAQRLREVGAGRGELGDHRVECLAAR